MQIGVMADFQSVITFSAWTYRFTFSTVYHVFAYREAIQILAIDI